MVKYFVSNTRFLWAWKDGVTKLWCTVDPVWTNSRHTYTLEEIEYKMRATLTEAEAKEIAGELPTW